MKDAIVEVVLLVAFGVTVALFGGCGDDDDDSGEDTDLDAATDTDTGSDKDTGSDTHGDSDTDADPDSGADPGGDYWKDGYCGDFENEVPASLDCREIAFEGCCDQGDKALWCERGMLFCRDCPKEELFCSWMGTYYGLSYYDCDSTDWGADPSGDHPEDCAKLEPGP